MNQLEYTGSHKSLSQRCSCFVYDASDYTEYDDFEISDFKTGINVKKQIGSISTVNEMEIIEAIGDFLK
jgi:magnesium transporter